MKQPYQKHQSALLKQLLASLPKTTKALERRFAEQFFGKLLVADLEKLDGEKAAALTRSMFEFYSLRDPTTPAIRIFTPTATEHGYSGNSVVIELINNDMPFLLDSLTMELTRQGLIIRETYHPILSVSRDKHGALQSIGEENDTQVESLIHFELSALPDGWSIDQLRLDLIRVLNHVRAAVTDWRAIVDKAAENIARLKKVPKGFDAAHVAEVRDFLSWLVEKNFVFLGYGEYEFVTTLTQEIKITGTAKLGILALKDGKSQIGLETMPKDQRHRLLNKQLVEITKSNRRSLVHRYVPMDYVALKRFDDIGNVVGEVRFLGLFTSNVYYQSIGMVPLLRDKISRLLARSGFPENSHDSKAFATILEFLPRDEIFQMPEDELFEICMGILVLEAKPGVRAFVRKDVFERFISAMVFVPRERFSTALRHQIQRSMETAYHGVTTAFNTQISDAPLARLHLIIRTQPGDVPEVDITVMETDIARLAYLWSDQLFDGLRAIHNEPRALVLHQRYANAFPQSYINRYNVQAACHDIEKSEAALDDNMLALELYQLKNDAPFAHLKIYNPRQEIALSDILPILENAGFRVIEEQPFLLDPKGKSERIWIRDFKLELPPGAPDITARREAVEAGLLASWQGVIENDRMNALVLLAGIHYRDVVVLRALACYMKQIGFNATQATIEQALGNHPAIAAQMVALFHARFAPDELQRDIKIHTLRTVIDRALETVASAVDDRILRMFAQLILAMLRTNFYQPDRPVLSFKFDSALVPGLPLPVPFAEIFVYSPRVEGIHLRGGKVARGGLRWSDRRDDFRTEVLGLMKAQMVKNAVIVPVGSKGGFVLKKPPVTGDREALQQEGITCYTLYLQGLLDITDNLVAGAVVPPTRVVRHDGDDPYLVVAADKGTASFSDIANGVSKAYGFWLGDAFASGGSAGYDHKAMGITARGAWISVARHFHELGKDIAAQDFTCVGIGDMAGDVFGNGMLLSQHTRLIAAFNHLHIFIDPTPDAAASFAERKRLFELPRSSWKDYDVTRISKGGGVFDRAAKMIELSQEAMHALGINKAKLSPDELIRAILLAPVDLLWNGGIGTYVKAEDETNEQVGDRTNNAVRVNGRELRCKVVGEGGNLGFTQKGRIEFARSGGAINSDAIDNSAGVDCSDHEVNIKIAFSGLVSTGKLAVEKRDCVLEAMTDEVADLVLKDNRLQTLALTVVQHIGAARLDPQIRLMHALEQKGALTRSVEFLPTGQQLAELKTRGMSLTRPEMAVLLAYSKMDLYKSLVESTLPDDAYFEAELMHYFPETMQRDYREAILVHPLRREIIGTMLTNSLVNRMGATFVNDLVETHGATPRDIAAGYAMVRDAFSLRTHWQQLDALTGKIPVAQQAQLFIRLQHFIRTMVTWLVVNMEKPLAISDIIARIIVPAQKRMLAMRDMAANEQAYTLIQHGAPAALAEFIANMDAYGTAFDIVHLATQNAISEDAVATIYGKIAEKFSAH